MSDDEEYSSSDDDSSVNEEFITSSKMGGKNLDGNGKPRGLGVLTLEDADDDESQFQRPDLAPVYAEDDGEGEEEDGMSEEEIEGECETLDSTTPKMSDPSGKKGRAGGKKGSSISGAAGGGVAARGNKTKSIGVAKKSSYDTDSKKNSSNNNSSKKKKKKPIGICMVATKYECVRRVAKKLAFKEVEENEDWSLYWTDTSVSIDRVNQMKKWQVNVNKHLNWAFLSF